MPDDRDPYDDIAHLDFDVEDPELAGPTGALDELPPPEAAGADPRAWAPSEDVDDGTWVLSDDDKLLQEHLDWRRYQRGRLFRLAAAVVAVALLAVSLSTLIGRRDGGGPSQTTIDESRLDFGPTSEEMANYLASDDDVRALDLPLDLVAGNAGTYDNRSFDELNAEGPLSASYGAEAGVVRRWTGPEGRSLEVAVYLFADGGTAEAARGRALAAAAAAGGTRSEQFDFALLGRVDGSSPWVAARSIRRFLITFEAVAVDEADVLDLLELTSETAAAVH